MRVRRFQPRVRPCTGGFTEEDDSHTAMRTGGGDQRRGIRDCVGACRDDGELPADRRATEPELERRGESMLAEEFVVIACHAQQQCKRVVCCALLCAVEVSESCDIEVDKVEVAVGEVVARRQLHDHGTCNVLDGGRVASDRNGAERLQVDKDGIAVSFTDGHEPGDDRGLRLCGPGEVQTPLLSCNIRATSRGKQRCCEVPKSDQWRPSQDPKNER
jgi:hypothetical protein